MIYSNNINPFYIAPNASIAVTVLGTGNVGIGTTSPANKLSVSGSADFSGSIGIGTASPSAALHILLPGAGANLRLDKTTTNPQILFAMGGVDKWEVYSPAGIDSFNIKDSDAGAERLMIDNSGNVGIGTTGPVAKLDISGDSGVWAPFTNNQIGMNNYARRSYVGVDPDGSRALIGFNNYVYSSTGVGSDDSSWYTHYGTLQQNGIEWGTYGNVYGYYDKFLIRSGAGFSNYYGLYLDTYTNIDGYGGAGSRWGVYQADVGAKNYFGGNVGIGTTNPTQKLQVGTSGDGSVAIANAWNTFSDIRLKRDLVKLPEALHKLEKLNGYYYFWKNGEDQSRQVGVVAQEVEQVLPELVKTGQDGIKTVDYPKLTALLIEAAKQLKADKDRDIARLDAENSKLKADAEKKGEDISQLKIDNDAMKVALCKIKPDAAFCVH